MKKPSPAPNGIFEVTGHYRKAGAVVLDRFDARFDALAFARDAVDRGEPDSGDLLVSVTVADKAAGRILSTFHPDRYEAESLDDDDDG